MSEKESLRPESREICVIKRAVEQAFDGCICADALDYLDGLAELERENALLLERHAETKRHYECMLADANVKVKARARRLERIKRRQKFLAQGKLVGGDGKPVKLGESLYGDDGRDWLIVGACDKRSYEVVGIRGEPSSPSGSALRPLRCAWLTHEPRAERSETLTGGRCDYGAQR